MPDLHPDNGYAWQLREAMVVTKDRQQNTVVFRQKRTQKWMWLFEYNVRDLDGWTTGFLDVADTSDLTVLRPGEDANTINVTIYREKEIIDY